MTTIAPSEDVCNSSGKGESAQRESLESEEWPCESVVDLSIERRPLAQRVGRLCAREAKAKGTLSDEGCWVWDSTGDEVDAVLQEVLAQWTGLNRGLPANICHVTHRITSNQRFGNDVLKVRGKGGVKAS